MSGEIAGNVNAYKCKRLHPGFLLCRMPFAKREKL